MVYPMDTHGVHSDHGSTIPGIPQEIRSREKISARSAHVFAYIFDAVLAVIVVLAGEPTFERKYLEGSV